MPRRFKKEGIDTSETRLTRNPERGDDQSFAKPVQKGLGQDSFPEVLEELGLRRGDRILMDSSAIIILAEGSVRDRAAMELLAETARSGALCLWASTLAWTETLAGPAILGDKSGELTLRRMLSDSSLIRLFVLDVAVADMAALLRAGGNAALTNGAASPAAKAAGAIGVPGSARALRASADGALRQGDDRIRGLVPGRMPRRQPAPGSRDGTQNHPLLGLADSIHLATAIVQEAEAFLSADRALIAAARGLPKGPRTLLLEDLADLLG